MTKVFPEPAEAETRYWSLTNRWLLSAQGSALVPFVRLGLLTWEVLNLTGT